ncbi:hypothetical protein QTP88_019874 [Uroleucon formosanum]
MLQSMRMCEKAWRNVQPSTIVNCFKKAGFYFNDEQCVGDGLENNDYDDVSGPLTNNEIMGINISNSDSENNENDELETALNMIMANQAMSS